MKYTFKTSAPNQDRVIRDELTVVCETRKQDEIYEKHRVSDSDGQCSLRDGKLMV